MPCGVPTAGRSSSVQACCSNRRDEVAQTHPAADRGATDARHARGGPERARTDGRARRWCSTGCARDGATFDGSRTAAPRSPRVRGDRRAAVAGRSRGRSLISGAFRRSARAAALRPRAAGARLQRAAARRSARARPSARRRATLGLDAEPRVRVRLTGTVPLADEEFGTLADRRCAQRDRDARRA